MQAVVVNLQQGFDNISNGDSNNSIDDDNDDDNDDDSVLCGLWRFGTRNENIYQQVVTQIHTDRR